MRDPRRIPQVIEVLSAYWEQHPDLRLGQIIGNFNITYNTEDRVLVEAMLGDMAHPDAGHLWYQPRG